MSVLSRNAAISCLGCVSEKEDSNEKLDDLPATENTISLEPRSNSNYNDAGSITMY